MDTPIRIIFDKMYMSNLGEVMEKRLKTILKSLHHLVIHVVKVILGEEFINAFQRYHVTLESLPCVFENVLNMGKSKDGMKLFRQKIF